MGDAVEINEVTDVVSVSVDVSVGVVSVVFTGVELTLVGANSPVVGFGAGITDTVVGEDDIDNDNVVVVVVESFALLVILK